MCGGIVGALTFGMTDQASQRRKLGFLTLYNLGRLTSYTVAGIIVGWIGAITTQQFASHTLHQFLQTLSGVFMILMGLYLARWWLILNKLEQAGGVIWRRIEPLARKLIPIHSFHQALLVGVLWGWLPCGLVYSMLSMSLTSSSAMQGGLIMLSFGLGTLPNLMLMGLFAASLQKFMQHRLVRIVAGLMVVGLGCVLIYQAWIPTDVHAHHQH
jgi:sulfite exporter TauE/SafE